MVAVTLHAVWEGVCVFVVYEYSMCTFVVCVYCIGMVTVSVYIWYACLCSMCVYVWLVYMFMYGMRFVCVYVRVGMLMI